MHSMDTLGLFVPLRFLREINFVVFRSSKTAIFAFLKALSIDFHEFSQLEMVENHQITKIQSPQKWQKKALLEHQNSPKLISLEI